jgi:DNA invertase Pin-like site-specific DNA recombinase
MQTPESAGIYCRLSFSPDGSLEKVERQEADCRKLAQRLGWKVRDVYPDNSRSAWQRNRKRPEWDRMLTDIEAGQLDGILVYHGDRLIRQPWDLETLLKLADDRHLPLAAPHGTRDLNNEDDRFILRIEVAQACKASADTSRRVKRGWKARAEQGLPVSGGRRPFGRGIPTGETGKTGKPLYDITQQVPKEAAIVREAVDRMMAGESQYGVLKWMNSVSTTTEGNLWIANSLKRLIMSPGIAGLVEHDGQLYDAAWEGILTVEEWEDVKSVWRLNAAKFAQPGRERRYLLSGIAECGCGGTVVTKPHRGRNKTTARLYYCRTPGCKHRVSRNVEHLDAYITGRVLRLLNDPEFIAALHADAAQPGLGAEIAALERRKTQDTATLEELADHPEVDAGLLVRGLASYDRKIAQLRSQMEATSRQRLIARMSGISREQWEAEPIDVRAETVRALFRVTILPVTRRGPGFDPESVRVERR